MAPKSARDLASSLERLKIQSDRHEPADSWEDEADDASPVTPRKHDASTGLSSPGLPGPPPPTPSSPSYSSAKTRLGDPYQTFPPYGFDGVSAEPDDGVPAIRGVDERRPEKSTAVASRLIAAGIGQKVPKRTKEQREYDQAMKVQEKKKRDQAKAEEERKKAEKEKAKQAIWDD